MIESLEDRQYNHLQKIGDALKIVRQRQQSYSELLNFIKKNINSSSQQINQLTIFLQFVRKSLQKNSKLTVNEEELIAGFQEDTCITTVPIKKELNRFCARLVEILDYSMVRTRESIVFTSTLQNQHLRLKKDLNSMLNKDTIKVRQFLGLLWDYERIKYRNQIQKVENYVAGLETGDNLCFRQFYEKDCSKKDQEKTSPTHGQNRIRSVKKTQKNSSSKSKQKSKGKQLIERDPEDSSSNVSQSKKQLKNKMAYKLLRQYNLLELSKKEFIQDLVFQQNQEHQQKRKVFYNLWQKNKINKQHIKQFSKKINSVPNISKVLCQRAQKFTKPLDTQVTVEEARDSLNSSNTGKKISNTQRNSFVISRIRHRRDLSGFSSPRKTQRQQLNSDVDFSTFIIQQPQAFIVPQIAFREQFTRKQTKQVRSEDKKPIKQMTPRPKRIYVVKSPVLFQDETLQIEPQMKHRKYQPPRFKRRNYQFPLEKSQIPRKGSKIHQFPF